MIQHPPNIRKRTHYRDAMDLLFDLDGIIIQKTDRKEIQLAVFLQFLHYHGAGITCPDDECAFCTRLFLVNIGRSLAIVDDAQGKAKTAHQKDG
ncbi:hypothetical protein SDC9_155001 [bioreactor metagenome]|uniref:Uncharacterized protein n=1 Tax=bioreactor metagenome TaxID=1076179 RepID=A0A645F2T8_9ZZZZ